MLCFSKVYSLRQVLICVAGLHVTALVARVLSSSARKLQTSCISGVAHKDQITMAGFILAGEFLKTRSTEEGQRSVQAVSREYNVGV